jgi:lysophospholipase L1-like esterase
LDLIYKPFFENKQKYSAMTDSITNSIKSGETIVFLGDSITAGGIKPDGYVTLVMLGLKANGIEAKAIGAGIGGHKSNQMLERLQNDVISKKPAWMTLSCGVNDVWHGANGVPLDQYKENITAIIEQAQAAGIKVMILTATVIGENLDNPDNRKLAGYNEFLRSLARAKKCLLADLNAAFHEVIKTAQAGKPADKGVLTGDGVHMNSAGNRVMAKGILKAFGLSARELAKAVAVWPEPDNATQE